MYKNKQEKELIYTSKHEKVSEANRNNQRIRRRELIFNAAIELIWEDYNIRIDTNEAKDEHTSNGNELGIIDRFIKILRGQRDFDIKGHSTGSIKNVVPSAIETWMIVVI